MSPRLEVALRDLERAFPGLEEVVRVDVDDEGVLTLTAAGAAGTRWFTHAGEGLVERFPQRDPKLPLSARLAASEDWRVLSYRPGRRMVVVVEGGEHAEVHKGHRRPRSARAARNHGIAEAAMRRGAMRVPRLLRHDDAHETLVFEFLAGEEVELDAASVELYRSLGERLAVFQRDGDAADVKVFGPDDELAVLETWRRKVERVAGGVPAGWPEAHARLELALARLPQPELGLAHRDLHDRQVRRAGADVAVLDFDLLCRADVALDPANLVAHLRWRACQGLHRAGPESVRALEQAFLDGLGRAAQRGFAARVAFYSASSWLRLALVYRLRPRWSARVVELVALAGAALDDLAPAG